mmetsp:Transcript_32749/g.71505  ORF Transcript_32749/g.71505 Transcript_32749/m.71505 type:complete len:198 (-) Transcript_32749:87-680(-)
MARVGVANYHHSTDDPVKAARQWNDTLERERREHTYSALNDPFPQTNYTQLNTTSNEFLGRTWQVLHHTRSVAAGKHSFHHNVAKPPGAVRAGTASCSFERPISQCKMGRATAAAGAQILGASMSTPTLRPWELDKGQGASPGPQQWDAASTRSSARSSARVSATSSQRRPGGHSSRLASEAGRQSMPRSQRERASL